MHFKLFYFRRVFLFCSLCFKSCTYCTSNICLNCEEKIFSLFEPKLFRFSSANSHFQVLSFFPYVSPIVDLIHKVKVERCRFSLNALCHIWEKSLRIVLKFYDLDDYMASSMPYSLYSRLRLKFPLSNILLDSLSNVVSLSYLKELYREGFYYGKRSIGNIRKFDLFTTSNKLSEKVKKILIVDDVVTTGFSYARLFDAYESDKKLGICFTYSQKLSTREIIYVQTKSRRI